MKISAILVTITAAMFLSCTDPELPTAPEEQRGTAPRDQIAKSNGEENIVPAPTDFTATPAGENKTILSWKPVSQSYSRSGGYWICRGYGSAHGNFPWLVTMVGANVTSYIDTLTGGPASLVPLTAGTTNTYTLRRFERGKNGELWFSDPVYATATTDDCTPGVPVNFASTPISQEEVRLTWQQGFPATQTSFEIQRSLDGSNFYYVFNPGPTMTWFNDSPGSGRCGAIIYHRIRAVTLAGADPNWRLYYSPFSAVVSATTDACTPGTPTEVTAKELTRTSWLFFAALLEWKPGNHRTETYVLVSIGKWIVKKIPAGQYSCVIENLPVGVPYRFTVTPVVETNGRKYSPPPGKSNVLRVPFRR